MKHWVEMAIVWAVCILVLGIVILSRTLGG